MTKLTLKKLIKECINEIRDDQKDPSGFEAKLKELIKYTKAYVKLAFPSA